MLCSSRESVLQLVACFGIVGFFGDSTRDIFVG